MKRMADPESVVDLRSTEPDGDESGLQIARPSA
jgi:hypothetical protein